MLLSFFREGAILRHTFQKKETVNFVSPYDLSFLDGGNICSTDAFRTEQYVFQLKLNGENADPLLVRESDVLVFMPSLPDTVIIDCQTSTLSPDKFGSYFFSHDFTLVLEAVSLFWNDALGVTANNPDSYPSKEAIIKWLQEKEFSKRAAEEVERIIRPGFAGGSKGPSAYTNDLVAKRPLVEHCYSPAYRDAHFNHTKNATAFQGEEIRVREGKLKVYKEIVDADLSIEEAATHFKLEKVEIENIIYECRNHSNPYGFENKKS